jgi:hypothetical protein
MCDEFLNACRNFRNYTITTLQGFQTNIIFSLKHIKICSVYPSTDVHTSTLYALIVQFCENLYE